VMQRPSSVQPIQYRPAHRAKQDEAHMSVGSSSSRQQLRCPILSPPARLLPGNWAGEVRSPAASMADLSAVADGNVTEEAKGQESGSIFCSL
jgi:hypothetical protein